jgi:hypothetical protein
MLLRARRYRLAPLERRQRICCAYAKAGGIDPMPPAGTTHGLVDRVQARTAGECAG